MVARRNPCLRFFTARGFHPGGLCCGLLNLTPATRAPPQRTPHRPAHTSHSPFPAGGATNGDGSRGRGSRWTPWTLRMLTHLKYKRLAGAEVARAGPPRLRREPSKHVPLGGDAVAVQTHDDRSVHSIE